MKFTYDASKTMARSNIMDKWILSFNQSLVQFVHQEMAGKKDKHTKGFALYIIHSFNSCAIFSKYFVILLFDNFLSTYFSSW